MALPAAFLEELRARTPLAAVIGRRVKLVRSGRQWKACCPFHGEKTPSFYVYDDHFHCFGCGAHGDAIGFVMQAQGASFVEAVQQLAAEAGLQVPAPTPDAAEADRRRRDLHAVLDAAAAAFQRRLRLPEGAAALAYLRKRGLGDETIATFGLGWSGEGRGALVSDLARQDIAPEQMEAAGLMQAAEEGRPARELFFNRVMFPIRDAGGRIVSFGGRTLGDGQPKYLNGPETALFSKRRTLYGLDLARAGVRAGAAVVVVEGYMDVIALHQAGFAGAVAPLGTALTEDQLGALWRLAPMPVLCFDGDAAGARAAARAADVALPLISPERSLRFAALPAGEDPDTLVRRAGAAGFATVLDAATALADVLYASLRTAAGDRTPEQRAALRKTLEAAAGRITDKALAGEMRRALLDRFFAERPRKGWAAPVRAIVLPRPAPDAAVATAERCRTLVAILLRHPALLHEVEEEFGHLDLSPPMARLRAAIHAWHAAEEAAEMLDSATLITHLTAAGLRDELAQALADRPMPLPTCARPGSDPVEARTYWGHITSLMRFGRLEEDLAVATQEAGARLDEAMQTRLITLRGEVLRRGEAEAD